MGPPALILSVYPQVEDDLFVAACLSISLCYADKEVLFERPATIAGVSRREGCVAFVDARHLLLRGRRYNHTAQDERSSNVEEP